MIKKQFFEQLLSDLERMSQKEVDRVKSRFGTRFHWARESHGFDINTIGSCSDFKLAFGRTYEKSKFKEVENGRFGKKLSHFVWFFECSARFFNIPPEVFYQPILSDAFFKSTTSLLGISADRLIG